METHHPNHAPNPQIHWKCQNHQLKSDSQKVLLMICFLKQTLVGVQLTVGLTTTKHLLLLRDTSQGLVQNIWPRIRWEKNLLPIILPTKLTDVIYLPSLLMRSKKLGKTTWTCIKHYLANKLEIAFIAVAFSTGLKVDPFHHLLKIMDMNQSMACGALHPPNTVTQLQTTGGSTLVLMMDPRVVTTRYICLYFWASDFFIYNFRVSI